MKIDKSLQSATTVPVSSGKNRTIAISNLNAEQESNVHLSSNVARLQNIDISSVNNSIVNTTRVQEIKQAISEGNFQVNPEIIADRLLETVKELMQSKKDAV